MSVITYEFSRKQDTLIATLKGSLDASNSVQFGNDLQKQLDDGTVANIAFEVSALNNMASAGLRVVMIALKHCQGKRGKFFLVAPNQNIRQLMRISNIGMFMEITDSLTAAELD